MFLPTQSLMGKDVAAYLDDIIPPVLGCFSDQDSRLRYYALESMYNIAKVAKGEILLYFNDVFDALCKVGPPLTLLIYSLLPIKKYQ
jgi:vacuole morphology and inheritance protein 14